MNIFIGSDHAGFELKQILTSALSDMGHMVVDCGAYALHETDDYPYFVSKVGKAVSESESIRAADSDSFQLTADASRLPHQTFGIVIGGTGNGEAVVANKYPHVRAAVCHGGEHAEDVVRLSREHNNANVLSLGARFLSHDQAVELVILWIETRFSGDERHVRRIHEIDRIEDDKNEPLYE